MILKLLWNIVKVKMENCHFEIVTMKIVDRLIVKHINIQLNTPNKKVERILISLPTLVRFAANTILTTYMSFLEKGITYPIQIVTLAKNHMSIKTLCM